MTSKFAFTLWFAALVPAVGACGAAAESSDIASETELLGIGQQKLTEHPVLGNGYGLVTDDALEAQSLESQTFDAELERRAILFDEAASDGSGDLLGSFDDGQGTADEPSRTADIGIIKATHITCKTTLDGWGKTCTRSSHSCANLYEDMNACCGSTTFVAKADCAKAD